MNIKYYQEDKLLKIELEEDIDHHTTEEIRRRVDYEIERHIPRKVIFDFNNVSFMDSAGIGMLLGRYKLVNMLGGEVEICNTNQSIKRILRMCGIVKLINVIEKNDKEAI